LQTHAAFSQAIGETDFGETTSVCLLSGIYPKKRLEHLEIRFLTIWGLVFQQDGSPAPKDQQDADVTRPFSAATLQYPAVSNIFKLDTVDR
jgi:hypothetical protein